MKEINRRYYDEGCKIWEARTDEELEEFEEETRHFEFSRDFEAWDDSDWWEYFMEEVANHAYDSGDIYSEKPCKVNGTVLFYPKSIEEAYFVICEVMTVEEANEWLAEWIDEEEMLGAVA